MPNNNKGSGAAAGLGIAALAAAAAGAYFFYGSEKAGKRRKQLKSWAVKAQGDVMEKIEQMQDVSQGAYDAAVTEVMAKYKKFKNVDPAELAAAASEMKKQWNKIASHLKTPAPKRKKPASKKK